jgi:hypothetical protein
VKQTKPDGNANRKSSQSNVFNSGKRANDSLVAEFVALADLRILFGIS